MRKKASYLMSFNDVGKFEGRKFFDLLLGFKGH